MIHVQDGWSPLHFASAYCHPSIVELLMKSGAQVDIQTKVHISIAGNFGEIFNLANWRFCRKSPNLKSANIISCTIALCGGAHNRQI